jgi:hypothetical protein
VPLQGHWQRVNTPLRKTTGRERLLVRAVAVVVGIAVVATIVVAIATNGSGTSPGCVQIDVPSTMGGSTIHVCDEKAAAFCRSSLAHQPPLNGTALPKCRAAGYE